VKKLKYMNATNAVRGINMKKTEFRCDYCNANITNCHHIKHSLTLSNRSYGGYGENISALYVHPILEEEKHFCGIRCLGDWLRIKNDNV